MPFYAPFPDQRSKAWFFSALANKLFAPNVEPVIQFLDTLYISEASQARESSRMMKCKKWNDSIRTRKNSAAEKMKISIKCFHFPRWNISLSFRFAHRRKKSERDVVVE